MVRVSSNTNITGAWPDMTGRFIAAAALLAAPAGAHAEAIVDQVERLDVERGEAEWELQTLYARSTADDALVVMANLSAEVGLRDWLALGFELESEREGVEALEAEMLSLQLKTVLLDPAEAPLGVGAQISLGGSFHGQETELEVRLLAEKQIGAWALASDIAFETPLAGDEEHDASVRYAARVDWTRPWGLLGLEAGGEWGTLESLRWSSEDRHWLGPIAAVALTDRFAIEAGYFAALSDATPQSQFRIEIALR